MGRRQVEHQLSPSPLERAAWGARVTLGAAEHDPAEQPQYVGLQVPGDGSVVSVIPYVVRLQNGSIGSMQVCTNISTEWFKI